MKLGMPASTIEVQCAPPSLKPNSVCARKLAKNRRCKSPTGKV